MINEWGPPLTGEEMKALKGRIDPEAMVRHYSEEKPYKDWGFMVKLRTYSFPANHPYYKVREYNQKHGTNLVLHDGSDEVPDDWDGGSVLVCDSHVRVLTDPDANNWDGSLHRAQIIAYTPKPKESEVTEDEYAEQAAQDKAVFEGRSDAVKKMLRAEGDDAKGVSPAKQFPKDEAIEYVLREVGLVRTTVEDVKHDPGAYTSELLAARLIQQYEPDRLKPAVDVAAEEHVKRVGMWSALIKTQALEVFKAGAAWQKESGK